MIDPRERINEQFNRARLEIELKRSLRPLVVLAVGAAVGLAAWAFLLGNVGKGVYTGQYEVRFAVPDATSVVAGRHDVRIKGIEVGTISDVELTSDGPVVTASIYEEWGPVYRDARARLRPNTALEDMYLDIVDRGSAAAGVAEGEEPIPAAQVEATVQIEEVLQAFDPNVRKHLGGLLANLGGGLDGRGDELRRAFRELTPLLTVTAQISEALARRAQRTRRLVTNFRGLTAELRRRDRDLHELVDRGGATLGALADGSRGLDATLRELPATLEELDSSFAAVRRVLPDVDRALMALRPAVRELPAGLSGLRRLSGEAQPALRALQPSVRRLQPLARSLRPVAADLAGAAEALTPQVDELEYVTARVADCTIAVYGFFQWTASVTKFWDSRGVFPRGDAAISLNAPGGAARDPNHFPAYGCMRGKPKTSQP